MPGAPANQNEGRPFLLSAYQFSSKYAQLAREIFHIAAKEFIIEQFYGYSGRYPGPIFS
jgi:hypothetical protein